MGFKCPLCNMEGGHAIGCHAPEIAAATIEHARICSELAKAKEEIAALKQRLANAEGLANFAKHLPHDFPSIGLLEISIPKKSKITAYLNELQHRADAFLAHADTNDEKSGPCQVCQSETTYAGSYKGDYPVWLCPEHGGEPPNADTEYVAVRRKTLYEALLSVPPGTTDGKKITHHWWWDELRADLEVKFHVKYISPISLMSLVSLVSLTSLSGFWGL